MYFCCTKRKCVLARRRSLLCRRTREGAHRDLPPCFSEEVESVLKSSSLEKKRKKIQLDVEISLLFSALPLSLSQTRSLFRSFALSLALCLSLSSAWISAWKMEAPSRRRLRLQQLHEEKDPLPPHRRRSRRCRRRACGELGETLLRRSTREACSLLPLQDPPSGAPGERP